FDDDRHVVGRLAVGLGQARRRVEEAHRQRLRTAAPVGDAELDPRALAGRGGAVGQGGGVQEDVLAVIGRDEAEPLLVVVEPDLAGGHWKTSLWMTPVRAVCAGRSGPAPPS